MGGLIILATLPQGIDQLGSGALGILIFVLMAFHLCIAVLLVGALLARQRARALRARFLEIDHWGVRWFDSARHEIVWGDIAEVERHPLGLGLRLIDGRQLVIGVPDPKEDQGRASPSRPNGSSGSSSRSPGSAPSDRTFDEYHH